MDADEQKCREGGSRAKMARNPDVYQDWIPDHPKGDPCRSRTPQRPTSKAWKPKTNAKARPTSCLGPGGCPWSQSNTHCKFPFSPARAPSEDTRSERKRALTDSICFPRMFFVFHFLQRPNHCRESRRIEQSFGNCCCAEIECFALTVSYRKTQIRCRARHVPRAARYSKVADAHSKAQAA